MESHTKYAFDQFMKNGVHLGHHANKYNSEMLPYILGARSNLHIINIEATIVMLRNASSFLNSVVSSGGSVLFVCSKGEYSPIIEDIAKKTNQYYINKQWIGGLLTNFTQVKEKLQNTTKCSHKFLSLTEGIRNMKKLPDIIIVFGVLSNSTALHEAELLKIPSIAIVDTNCTLQKITYPIPGNDDSILSINLFCQMFGNVILSGLHKSR